MTKTEEICSFCDQLVRRREIPDFPGAFNGLQVANRGAVGKIGAAVDAGKVPFERAISAGVDFLIVHHGLFWDSPHPVTGPAYDRLRALFEHDVAVYSSHLPLDCHPDIGNNAIIAEKLGLVPDAWIFPYEGNPIAASAPCEFSREALLEKLRTVFPGSITPIEFGSARPRRVAILSGSGASVISELRDHGIDTLITGEAKQNHFNYAQENEINLYLCGHYATETFGVSALAKKAADHFGLPWEFIATECPL